MLLITKTYNFFFFFQCWKIYLFFQFEGTTGEKLIQVSAEFTKNQKFSIEELKERRKRDHKLDLFLNEQRLRPECRRLGLEALLPVEHQRLVKYPLLLEQLAKQCDKESEEYAKVRRCVDRSREILDSIDKQVAEAQNIQRLAEIQRNLDTSGLEKMAESPITNEYRVSIIKLHFFSFYNAFGLFSSMVYFGVNQDVKQLTKLVDVKILIFLLSRQHKSAVLLIQMRRRCFY